MISVSLVPSLLRAIVQADGDALVVHAGEKACVVSSGGQVEVGSRALTPDAITGIVAQLLPVHARKSLDELGRAEHEVPPLPEFPEEVFTVVVTDEGDDVWVEIRRRRDVPGDPLRAVVIPMSRNPIRPDIVPAQPDSTTLTLERLLRTAAVRGASALYVSTGQRPLMRVDGELQTIDAEVALSSNDVASVLMTLVPERSRESQRAGPRTEWISEVPRVGRVRCRSFSDHHGPGAVFRLVPQRVASADELGLSREIRALAIEPEGLVVVAGPRSSGKRTLIAALVDDINRMRRDHVITIEREVGVVHQRGSSFISQREVSGSDDEMLAAARAALREDPDVLVFEHIGSSGMMKLALEAAASGHLVIGGFAAPSSTATIDRILDLYAPDDVRQVRFALANSLRGVIAQVLVRRKGGGRLSAREVLLSTPVVRSLIAEGKASQLPMAIEEGRDLGMASLVDSLVGLVRSGAVDPREAYRHVTDRGAFLARLEREGLDTSFLERMA